MVYIAAKLIHRLIAQDDSDNENENVGPMIHYTFVWVALHSALSVVLISRKYLRNEGETRTQKWLGIWGWDEDH